MTIPKLQDHSTEFKDIFLETNFSVPRGILNVYFLS